VQRVRPINGATGHRMSDSSSDVVGQKSRRGRQLQFFDRQLQLTDRAPEDIMDAQNFNVAPKFPPNSGFLAQIVVYLDINFPTKRKFSDKLKFRAPIRCSSATFSGLYKTSEFRKPYLKSGNSSKTV